MADSDRVQAFFAGTYLLTVVGAVLIAVSAAGSTMAFRLGVGAFFIAVVLGVFGLAAKLNVLSAQLRSEQTHGGPAATRADTPEHL